MRLTHRQIEVFRAVMATGNVTRAAERLHTSQPTVSRELARLEQQLQLPLFERVKGRLRPTPQATALMEEVERWVHGLERIADTARALREAGPPRLAIACLPALAQALVPEATRRLAERQPRATVSITPLESPALEAALTEQRFDLGLVEREEAPPATVLQPLLLADEVAVLPEGHPLLSRRVLSPSDFAGEAFVSFAPADPYRAEVDALFAAHRVERRLAVETSSAASVCALVRQGLGLAIVNPLTATALAGHGLALRPLSVSIPFRVGLVLPAHRAAHPLREAYVEALRESAHALKASLKSLRASGSPRARAARG